MAVPRFVPEDFDPPGEYVHREFHLVPLGAEHNDSDHAAWTSSIPHPRHAGFRVARVAAARGDVA